MRMIRHDPVICPYCETQMDCLTPTNHDAQPEEGALAVCAYCGGVWEMGEGLQPKVLLANQLLDADVETILLLKKAREFIIERKSNDRG